MEKPSQRCVSVSSLRQTMTPTRVTNGEIEDIHLPSPPPRLQPPPLPDTVTANRPASHSTHQRCQQVRNLPEWRQLPGRHAFAARQPQGVKSPSRSSQCILHRTDGVRRRGTSGACLAGEAFQVDDLVHQVFFRNAPPAPASVVGFPEVRILRAQCTDHGGRLTIVNRWGCRDARLVPTSS